jgi:hypothetical protein
MDMHEGSRRRVTLERMGQLVTRDVHEMTRQGVVAYPDGDTLPIRYTHAIYLAALKVVCINRYVALGRCPYDFGEIADGHGVEHLQSAPQIVCRFVKLSFAYHELEPSVSRCTAVHPL